MLFPIRLRLTKAISVSSIVSLLMMSLPEPVGGTIVHRRLPAVAMQAAMPPQNSQPTMQQVINVALWRTDHGFVSTMHLKNSLMTGSVTAWPILYAEDGEEYDLPSTTIPGAGIATVVVNQALDSMPAQERRRFGDFGSAAIKYSLNGAGGINASMQVLDVSASLSYNFQFFSYMPMSGSMPMSSSSTMPEPMQQVSEGIWWKHDRGVEGHVSLANTAAIPIVATVQLTGAKGSKSHLKSVTLQPHASAVLDLTELESDLRGEERDRGGVTIKYLASSSQIAMDGWLENAAEGYSAKIPFVEKMPEDMSQAAAAASYTFAGVGIMYGEQMAMMGFPKGTRFVPYAEIRNVSAKQVRVSVTVLPANGGVGTEKPLGDLLLNAYETKHLDPDLIRKALPEVSGNINLTFSYNGMLGDLMFATGAVDQTGNYVFEVPIGGTGPSRGREVNYWSVKDGDDTMISLWNPTAAAETLNVTLYFGGTSGNNSQYVIGVPLAPRAAANISLMDLIMSGNPDAKGNVIPRSATVGSLVISAASGRHDSATYVATVAVFNAADATCYGNCTWCDGVCYIQASPSAYSIYVGQSAAPSGDPVYAYWSDGSQDDITYDVGWGGPTTSGVLDSSFNGIGAGTTDVYAQYQAPYPDCLECEESASCLSQWYYAYVPITVYPTISGPNAVWFFGTGLNPNSANYPVSITLSTSGSGNWTVTQGSDRVNFSPTSGSQITVTSQGSHFSGSVGDTCFQVTVNSEASPAFCITTRTPWKLVSNPNSTSTTDDQTYGYYTVLGYDIHDQLDTVISQDIGWNETVGTPQNLNGSNWATCCGSISTSGGSTGPLLDQLAPPPINSQPTPPNPSPTYHNPPSGTVQYRNAPQTIKVGNSSANGILVQTDSLTYWIDHGTHESIQIPSKPPQ